MRDWGKGARDSRTRAANAFDWGEAQKGEGLARGEPGLADNRSSRPSRSESKRQTTGRIPRVLPLRRLSIAARPGTTGAQSKKHQDKTGECEAGGLSPGEQVEERRVGEGEHDNCEDVRPQAGTCPPDHVTTDGVDKGVEEHPCGERMHVGQTRER